MSAASRNYYKRFLRITEQWPRDPIRKPHRDLGARVKEEVNLAFSSGPQNTKIRDARRCELALRGLEDLVSNKHKTEFPVVLEVGVLGIPKDALQTVTSDYQRTGLKAKVQTVFRRKETSNDDQPPVNQFTVPYTFGVKVNEADSAKE